MSTPNIDAPIPWLTTEQMVEVDRAMPKEGLRADGVTELVGELYLADIGVPPSLYSGGGLGFEVGPVFAIGDIVRLA